MYVLTYVLLFIYSAVLISMFVWAFINAFKTEFDFNDNPLALPSPFSLDNIKYVWENFNYKKVNHTFYVEEMLLYSILYAVGCSTVAVFVCSATAYIVSQFRCKFSDIIYDIVIFAMVIPIIGSAPSEMQIVKALGLYDEIWGMYVLKANFLGMYFLVYYAAFNSIPRSYAEAAKIDGANNFQVMFKIYYPLVLGSLLSIWLLYFINFWNDYQTPLLYLPSMPPVAYGLYIFNLKIANPVPTRLMACFFVLVPVLVLFLIFREKLMGNISMDGGVKG